MGFDSYLSGVNIDSLPYHYSDIVKETTGANPRKSDDLTYMATAVKEWFTSPKKPWLWLGGGAGIGKSTMLEALERVIRSSGYHVCFRSSARDFFARKHHSEYYHELPEEKTQEELEKCYAVILLDDVGTEKLEGKEYGEGNTPFADFVDIRYNWGRTHNVINIITSNLKPQEVFDRYGERTIERIKEMCCIVNCGNQSFR